MQLYVLYVLIIGKQSPLITCCTKYAVIDVMIRYSNNRVNNVVLRVTNNRVNNVVLRDPNNRVKHIG